MCRFIHTRVSALAAVTERVSPQVQEQYSVIQEQPFDGQCSSFGPCEDAPRWNHRTIFDVEIVLARSGGFKDLEVVKMKPLRLWPRCVCHCRKSSMKKWRNCSCVS